MYEIHFFRIEKRNDLKEEETQQNILIYQPRIKH